MTGLSVSSASSATAALSTIDSAMDAVSGMRSKLGAMQNRLNSTVDNLANVVTNTEASRSRIQDTDYAMETTALAKAQIIQQAATAMLAQANQQPQSVLSLLQ
jgi:flagellin